MPDTSRYPYSRLDELPALRLLLVSALAGLAASFVAIGATEAPQVHWKSFHPSALQRALLEDRLVLLVLEMPWSEATTVSDRELWSDPELIATINESFVPIRERADLRPDLMRRYPAEGWPGISVLLPNGSPLFIATGSEDAPPRRATSGYRKPANLTMLLRAAVARYRSGREEAVRVSQQMMEQFSASSVPTTGPLSEDLLWGLSQQQSIGFDKQRRYFGGPPRLPRFDLIELALVLSENRPEQWTLIGTSALDSLLANLIDPADGALYRMASGLDWENPSREKLLDRNARLVELLAIAYRRTGHRKYRDQAMKTASFILSRLSRDDGSFRSAVCDTCPDGVEETVLSGANARAAAALIRAGAVFDEEDLVARGLSAATFLRTQRYKKGVGVPRAVVDGRAMPPGTLVLDDQVEVAWAFLAAHEATGARDWLEDAAALSHLARANLGSAKTRALADSIPQPVAAGPLRFATYPLRPNSLLARVLVRLFYLTDDRSYRDAARELLRAFSGSYREGGLQIPMYGLAVYEYHTAPLMAHVILGTRQQAATALNRAAIGAHFPWTIVRTWNPKRDAQRLTAVGFNVTPESSLHGSFQGAVGARETDELSVKVILNELVERSKPSEAPALGLDRVKPLRGK